MMHLIQLVDTSVLDALYALREPTLTLFFISISELGRWQIVLPLTVVLALGFCLRRGFADAAGILTSVFGSGAMILVLKLIIQRPRPALTYQAYPEIAAYSFPSGHAGLSLAFYGFLAYLLLETQSTLARRTLIYALPVLIFLIGFSRLYLGVHYVSDVVFGFVVGGFFVWLGKQVRLRLL